SSKNTSSKNTGRTNIGRTNIGGHVWQIGRWRYNRVPGHEDSASASARAAAAATGTMASNTAVTAINSNRCGVMMS
ncbi:MAG TPA: hypothetical protein DCR05_10870, partial [Alphaproteobacteria bacterium]|nr:hypothetical protein [Alphaproteobacteria bacterium]